MKNIFKKILISIILIIVFFASKGFTQDINTTDFKAIHIVNTWQIPNSNGELLTFPITEDLISSKDYMILKSTVIRPTQTVSVNHAGISTNISTVYDTLHGYFICKRIEKFGLYYDSLSAPVSKIMAVDSVTKDLFRIPQFFYSIRGKGKDSMTVIRDERNGRLIEKFTDTRLGIQYPDSSYFYYQKKPLDYSYIIKEKRPDSMYLYKALIIYNPILKGTFPDAIIDIKKYMHSFVITEIDVPEQTNIKKLIEKFNKAYNSIGK